MTFQNFQHNKLTKSGTTMFNNLPGRFYKVIFVKKWFIAKKAYWSFDVIALALSNDDGLIAFLDFNTEFTRGPDHA